MTLSDDLEEKCGEWFGGRMPEPYCQLVKGHDGAHWDEPRDIEAEELLRRVIEHPTHNLDEGLMNDIDDWLYPAPTPPLEEETEDES